MLRLKNISKDYIIDKKPFRALKNISLNFPKKQFCCILGPSGCGKTTLLNIIGGLDQYTDGNLYIDGKSTKQYKSKDWDNYRNKRIGFVFQNYNLIPHLSILENVELSLTLDGVSRKERKNRAIEALKKVGLEDIYNKKPNQLSGGQMQRVAIARALISNPEVILADEPTGALDSKTSIQVMDIIKEVSKEHLVIMVTHNEELAEKYATRIIKMKDGEIIKDSDPSKFIPTPPNKKKKKEKKKTSMSFFTALKISIKSLFTKKGRTVLTSVAASFGIIGVALVLALSNGFSNYVGRIESETASQTPVNIPSYTVTGSQSEEETEKNETSKYPDSNNVYPYISPTKTSTYKYNIFSQKYINFLDKLKNEDNLINDYLVNYSDYYSFNLITEFPDSMDEKTEGGVGSVNYITSNYISSSLSQYTGLPTNYFHPLYGEEEYISESYEIIEGTYPTKSNELVLVVDNCNRINFSTLKALGFYNSSDSETNVLLKDGDTKVKPITWDTIKSKKYKAFSFNDYYKKDEIFTVTDGEGNTVELQNYVTNDLNELYSDDSKGIELKIVGILRPKKTTTIPLMTVGLCYLSSLQNELVNENDDTKNDVPIVDDFEKNLIIRNVNGYSVGNFASFVKDLLDVMQESSLSTTSLATLYNRYFACYGATDVSKAYTSINYYLRYAEGFGCEMIPDELLENGISDKNFMTEYINGMLEDYKNGDLTSAIKKAIGIYAYTYSYSTISNIVIFPKDLSSKSKLKEALNEYNKIAEDEYHANSEKEQIYYSDIASDITSGIGQMITIISVVLIIFASISLLVSCVMTGIITYTSVIERTKEIGILRAVGARKKDVSRLFQAESSIIGGTSGIIGCALAYLICIPANYILNSVYSDYNLGEIAKLSIYHVVLLVVISILLTLISGLIPSRIAAKKDPVIALRSE
jgi:putative ABC transport system permease protein